ncbi:penicillin-binding protein 1C [Spirochaetia bacterium]|nr:penicillin-binding protein 1C [Spirochaetia bacterium]
MLRIRKITLICLSAVFVLFLSLRITPYRDLKTFLNRPCSTRVHDRNGVLLQVIPLKDGMRREYLNFENIPPYFADVFIQAEDSRFYFHYGIDLIAIVRALFQNIKTGRRVSGASTITMQLARLIAETESVRRGAPQKIIEAFNAMRLESRFSKKEILCMYLNSVSFGFQTEGIASASRNFFAKEQDMLSPAEVFCLAVIPRRPAAYNPIASIENKQNCFQAAQGLQKRFAEKNKFQKKHPRLCGVSDQDFEFAVSNAKRFKYPFEMPHFVRFCMNSVPPDTADLTVTADINVQHYAENIIAYNVARYHQNRITNGSCIIIDNLSGGIIAWVGSYDFNNARDRGQIDGVLALNQPGSSMKPFLYSLALESGFEPASVLADVPMNFGSNEIYIPQNFNNHFNGPVLMRQALASSLNIPAVYLLYRLGVRNYADFLMNAGFNSLNKKDGAVDAGLGLALGNAPVSLYELVSAFSIFPNDGVLLPLKYNLNEKEHAAKKIISTDTARVVCSFLSDANARYMAFGRAGVFQTDFPAIFKTGTANQYQSIAALGASRRYSAAVWMGNFTGETVIGKTGSSIPASVVRSVLTFLHKAGGVNSQTPGFLEPESFVKKTLCAFSGMAPNENCVIQTTEYVRAGQTEHEICDWHYSENGQSAVRYPAQYQSWLSMSRRSGTTDQSASPLSIITPRNGFVYYANPAAKEYDSIPVEVIGGQNDMLTVLYDRQNLTVRRPFKFFLPLGSGTHTLTVQNGTEEDTVIFEVR